MSYSNNNICEFCGRVGAVKCSKLGKYICRKHYGQLMRYGFVRDNNPRSNNDPNEITIDGNIAYIDLYNQRNEKIFTTIIDSEDVKRVKDKKWRVSIKRGKPYVISGHGAGNQVYLARFLLNYYGENDVDHIDGDVLNNRKKNLRIVSHKDNVRNLKPKITNKIGIRGISEDKRSGKYLVDFSDEKERYYLKPWLLLEEAVTCRYFLETIVNKNFRFQENDENIFKFINKLSKERVQEIKSYVQRKVLEKEIKKGSGHLIRLRGLIDEDFINYKKPSLFLALPFCTFKCEKECGVQCCQNSSLARQPIIEISTEKLVQRYLENPISESVVMGGMEPFDSFDDVLNFISILRKYSDSDVILYSGYYKSEIEDKIEQLQKFSNIIVKFGRFRPNEPHHIDPILGVELASTNQYAEKIS